VKLMKVIDVIQVIFGACQMLVGGTEKKSHPSYVKGTLGERRTMPFIELRLFMISRHSEVDVSFRCDPEKGANESYGSGDGKCQ
jgi:hypothetical protein